MKDAIRFVLAARLPNAQLDIQTSLYFAMPSSPYSHQQLLSRMRAISPAKAIIEKPVTFTNQDVPYFRRKLQQFEQASDRISHKIG